MMGEYDFTNTMDLNIRVNIKRHIIFGSTKVCNINIFLVKIF